jgi:NAD/NADP transhydrogenase beta subunit
VNGTEAVMPRNNQSILERLEALEKDSHPTYDFAHLIARIEQLERHAAQEPIALRLEPGDIVVLRAPQALTYDQVLRLRDFGRAEFSAHQIVVLSAGVDVKVVKPSAITRVGSE